MTASMVELGRTASGPDCRQLLIGPVDGPIVGQVRILAEGIVEPLPFADWPPSDLAPTTAFTEAAIRAGLPEPGGFGRRDLGWCTTNLEVSQ